MSNILRDWLLVGLGSLLYAVASWAARGVLHRYRMHRELAQTIRRRREASRILKELHPPNGSRAVPWTGEAEQLSRKQRHAP